MPTHPLRTAWRRMWNRCRNKKHHKFYLYGARGISVCEKWRSFDQFVEDMGPRPIGFTLDRIDNNSGYSKSNCRWATATQQVINRRKFKKNKSGYIGVSLDNRDNRWHACISHNNNSIHLGRFKKIKNCCFSKRFCDVVNSRG